MMPDLHENCLPCACMWAQEVWVAKAGGLRGLLWLARSPGAINSTLWPSDDNGDADPNVVVLDGMVDVDLLNTTSAPFSFDTTADAQVGSRQAAILSHPVRCMHSCDARTVPAVTLLGHLLQGSIMAINLGQGASCVCACCPLQVRAASWAVQAMSLQGFYIRAGVDSTAVEVRLPGPTPSTTLQNPIGCQPRGWQPAWHSSTLALGLASGRGALVKRWHRQPRMLCRQSTTTRRAPACSRASAARSSCPRSSRCCLFRLTCRPHTRSGAHTSITSASHSSLRAC